MTNPSLFTVLRGFKVRTYTLDKFLVAHGKPHGTQTSTFPPIYKFDDPGAAPDEISGVLRSVVKAAAGDTRTDTSGVLCAVPAVEGHDTSAWAYVSYSYSHIYAQRRITAEDPSERVTPGFEELRREILGYSTSPDQHDECLMGLYALSTRERNGLKPAELKERCELPIRCNLCEQTFDLWNKRQYHRNLVHGMDEALNALPDNA